MRARTGKRRVSHGDVGRRDEAEGGAEAGGGGVAAPRGFRAAGMHTGIKRKRKDLAVIVSDGPATAAATFTTNRVQATPVHVTKEHVAQGPLRAVVCNSGNANAVTGDEGLTTRAAWRS